MRAILIAACLALSGCIGVATPSPATLAGASTLDETAAVGAELAYKAARTAVATAINAGAVKPGTPLALRIAAADERAYGALQVMRSAYRTGNAGSYRRAAVEALAAIEALRTTVAGASA